jgi:hypothetical protein
MTTTKKTTTSRTKKAATPKPAAKKTTTRKPAAPKTEKIQLTPNSYVHEIFSAVSAERTNAKKVEILQQYNENFIKSVLIWNFDESIQSVLPEGEVPIQSKEDADQNPSSSIRKEWSKFYNFVKGGNDAMNRLKKETMFINILESFHPGEAEILCLVKDKKLETKYKITKELVSEAYPDVQWGGRS